jgi:hypothetical protein
MTEEDEHLKKIERRQRNSETWRRRHRLACARALNHLRIRSIAHRPVADWVERRAFLAGFEQGRRHSNG